MELHNKKRPLVIYLEPRDEPTNALIGRGIADLGLSAEDTYMVMRDMSGVEHPVWECPYNLASSLVRKRRCGEARFCIWVGASNNRIKNGEFLSKRRTKKKKKK